MAFTVQELIEVLDALFPMLFPARNALYILGSIVTLWPIIQLARNQEQAATRQHGARGWNTSLRTILGLITSEEVLPEENGDTISAAVIAGIVEDLIPDLAYHVDRMNLQNQPLMAVPYAVLCTARRNCSVCPDRPALRRKDDAHFVNLLRSDLTRTRAILVSAHCNNCTTIYWPDRLSIRPDAHSRARILRVEGDASYLRISKSDQLWAHRDVARMQESAFFHLHSGWSSFTNYLNASRPGENIITVRQVRRLFVEHFARRMLAAHRLLDGFSCPTDPNTDDLMSAVVDTIGKGGGKAPGAFEHHCDECTHPKRYRTAPLNPNANPNVVIGVDDDEPEVHADAAVAQLPEQEPPEDDDQLFVNMTVMDGKVIQHAICAIDNCNNPLANYKDGRFCAIHCEQGWNDKCGIIPCGRPRAAALGRKFLACDADEHKAFFLAYQRRFGRLNFAGVQRVIRQQVHAEDQGQPGLQLRPTALPAVDGLPGNQVIHTFRPRSTYCIQTIQWACGYPIAWTKLYGSENAGNVANFLISTWDIPADSAHAHPSFVAYDKACVLLAHLQTSHRDSPWIESTRFIVNAWHYIGHRADDELCRTRCNPAPGDGSQPDLVLERTDDEGRVHRTRAFNLETAEQFNSWLDRYKALLEQMSASSYDFVVHVLFFLYSEEVKRRIAKRMARAAAQEEQEEDEAANHSSGSGMSIPLK